MICYSNDKLNVMTDRWSSKLTDGYEVLIDIRANLMKDNKFLTNQI